MTYRYGATVDGSRLKEYPEVFTQKGPNRTNFYRTRRGRAFSARCSKRMVPDSKGVGLFE
jgi:hypothetical protein